MSNEVKYISRQHTMKLNAGERTVRDDQNRALAQSVQCVRDLAFQRADERVSKLEKETGKRAVDRMLIESFTTSKGQPALTVRIEFILVDKSCLVQHSSVTRLPIV